MGNSPVPFMGIACNVGTRKLLSIIRVRGGKGLECNQTSSGNGKKQMKNLPAAVPLLGEVEIGSSERIYQFPSSVLLP
jgi:hypothetical protein